MQLLFCSRLFWHPLLYSRLNFSPYELPKDTRNKAHEKAPIFYDLLFIEVSGVGILPLSTRLLDENHAHTDSIAITESIYNLKRDTDRTEVVVFASMKW